MRFLKAIDVDEALVERAWHSVSGLGGYYSIADGVTKDVFRRMLFGSAVVLEAPNLLIRLQVFTDYVEIHPIAFGPSIFAHAKEALSDVMELRDRLFDGKPVCCIIPDRMRGAKRLALGAGMQRVRAVARMLSGVPVSCSVFERR